MEFSTFVAGVHVPRRAKEQDGRSIYQVLQGVSDGRAKAIVQAVAHYNDPKVLAEVSEDLSAPMVGINMDTLLDQEKMAICG